MLEDISDGNVEVVLKHDFEFVLFRSLDAKLSVPVAPFEKKAQEVLAEQLFSRIGLASRD